jgi:hypothetical protein
MKIGKVFFKTCRLKYFLHMDGSNTSLMSKKFGKEIRSSLSDDIIEYENLGLVIRVLEGKHKKIMFTKMGKEVAEAFSVFEKYLKK